jgi:hypothetical protein
MRFGPVGGTVFAVVAIAHAYRALQQLPLQVGSTTIPVWVSWAGALGAALLSVWGFRSRR